MTLHNVRVAAIGIPLPLDGAGANVGAKMPPLGVKIHGLPAQCLASLAAACSACGAAAPTADSGSPASPNVWLWASRRCLEQTLQRFADADVDGGRSAANEALDAIRRSDGPVIPVLATRSGVFEWRSRTFVMGIINVTPDSFSGDGVAPLAASSEEVAGAALARGLAMVEEGADLLDIGGESTRPGGAPVDADTELARVLPVVEALRRRVTVPLSIDTYRACVAEAALDAGADMINDVWGLRMDPAMVALVAERRVPVVIMHNRSRPRDSEQQARLGGRYVGVHYDDLMADVLAELRTQVDHALSRGVLESQIIVDPGIGFGKTVAQNLALVANAGELRVLGYPILMGTSRKSFVGYTLDLAPTDRLEGTLATQVAAVLQGGAHIVRAHDVRAATRALRMADALVRSRHAV